MPRGLGENRAVTLPLILNGALNQGAADGLYRTMASRHPDARLAGCPLKERAPGVPRTGGGVGLATTTVGRVVLRLPSFFYLLFQ